MTSDTSGVGRQRYLAELGELGVRTCSSTRARLRPLVEAYGPGRTRRR